MALRDRQVRRPGDGRRVVRAVVGRVDFTAAGHVATFVTDAGAFAATLTVNVIAGYAPPAGSWSSRVQVSVDNVHDQPVPAIAVA